MGGCCCAVLLSLLHGDVVTSSSFVVVVGCGQLSLWRDDMAMAAVISDGHG
jgi:hypothetical protein